MESTITYQDKDKDYWETKIIQEVKATFTITSQHHPCKTCLPDTVKYSLFKVCYGGEETLSAAHQVGHVGWAGAVVIYQTPYQLFSALRCYKGNTGWD